MPTKTKESARASSRRGQNGNGGTKKSGAGNQNTWDPEFRPKLDARPDTVDFRDQMYIPTLREVPAQIPLEGYLKVGVPVLDQGKDGACAGFGLATVANYLLRSRETFPDKTPVSPWMLYAMAQQFDTHDASAGHVNPANPDVGATARSAMKGWNRNGVCQSLFWTKEACRPASELVVDARLRPLGAYFRVNHKDLVAMHTALAEVGILYASAVLHAGWFKAANHGIISDSNEIVGGHAFAIVAFEKRGFWIQNSWGTGWGSGGFGLISYDDWLEHGTDVWVGRLGVPIQLQTAQGAANLSTGLTVSSSSYATPELSPHVISVRDEGLLLTNGLFGKNANQVRDVFRVQFPQETTGWAKKRLLLYAHGGLVSEDTAVARISSYWSNLKDRQIYLVGFVWHTDYLTTLGEILKDAIAGVRPEGVLGDVKDFMLDRLDDTLEPLARVASGQSEWDRMKSNAMAASESQNGGARIAAEGIRDFVNSLSPADKQNFELHVVGHSAGSIFLAPLLRILIQEIGIAVESCTLWAPACTIDVFNQYYAPLAQRGGSIKRLALFTLDDHTERADNCAEIYHKSLLYLVSDAFEDIVRVPLIHPDGQPLLGMEKFVRNNGIGPGGQSIASWMQQNGIDWVLSPNPEPVGSPKAAKALHHGDFSTDMATLMATISRILNVASVPGSIDLRPALIAQNSALRRQLPFD